ncbi:MAG: hypothetical protein EOP59_09855 [Sphingomonadales bacterium]|nr:MAG: hypothetical protein EOP59_09855 [Sphingomonadales bacterium]
MLGLATERWTAVTGAEGHAAQVHALAAPAMRPQDALLVGNWTDPALLAGEMFDTVLADYLLGAVEGFAPYFQSELFARLRPLTRRRLYVTGVEPYVVARPADEAGALVWEIGRFRDACLTLAGEQHYREYPIDWVLAQLRKSGFTPVAARKFPIRYKARFVNGQIDMCRSRLDALGGIGQALIAHGEALRDRALAHVEAHGSLRHGFDYVIAADPV